MVFFKALTLLFSLLPSFEGPPVWVYLPAMTRDFNEAVYLDNQKIIKNISRQLGIKIITVPPENRSWHSGDYYCWLNDSDSMVKNIKYIKYCCQRFKIEGFIGFCDGGSFLQKLALNFPLSVPVISIDAPGETVSTPGYLNNELVLLVRTTDSPNFDTATKFYRQALSLGLKIKKFEYSNGYLIPENLLRQVIKSFIKAKTKN